MSTNAPDVSALAAYGGDYEKQLFSTLVNSLDAVQDVTLIPNVKTKLSLTKLKVGNGARPYDVNFQGGRTGDLSYTPRVITADEAKRDLLIEPNKYRSTFMSTVQQPGHNPMDIPFAQYVWEETMRELGAEINDKTIYFGFDKSTAVAYNPASVYAVGNYIIFTGADGFPDYYKCLTITTAGQSPTTNPAKWQMVNAEAITPGLGARIAFAIASEGLVPLTLGTIDGTNAYGQYTALYRSLPVSYQNAGVNIYSSFSNGYNLMDDFENKVSKYTEIDPVTGAIYLSKTSRKCQIKMSTWMGNSTRLIATPKQNLLIGTDLLSDLNKINTFPQLRTIQAGIDFSLGTQIRDLGALAVSEGV